MPRGSRHAGVMGARRRGRKPPIDAWHARRRARRHARARGRTRATGGHGMKRLVLEPAWPSSWKDSYAYDLQEIYGEVSHRGYANAYQDRRQATLGLITDVLPAGARILDVAAAQGNFSLTLAEMGYEVTWNDLRADLAGYVRLKYERGTVHFAPGNLFTTRFSGQFDLVLATEIIEHVAHPDQFLMRVAALV